MAILAIETATDACSVALEHDGNVVADHRVVPRGHNRLLLPMIDGLLAQAGATRRDLALVGFGCGPGSFTGVRLAASAAQGIALALDVPVARVSTLEVLAHTARRIGPVAECIVTTLASRAEEVLLAAWRVTAGRVEEALAAQPLALGAEIWPSLPDAFVVAGDVRRAFAAQAASRGFAVAECPVDHPDARDLLPLARRERDAGRLVGPEGAIPVYLSGARPWPKAAARDR